MRAVLVRQPLSPRLKPLTEDDTDFNDEQAFFGVGRVDESTNQRFLSLFDLLKEFLKNPVNLQHLQSKNEPKEETLLTWDHPHKPETHQKK
jgi:hypothetical protein